MRIKGTQAETESGGDFWVVKESHGGYAIHAGITPEEWESFLSADGPYTYDEAIEMMQEAVSGAWDE